jgi:hypothetical protein
MRASLPVNHQLKVFFILVSAHKRPLFFSWPFANAF